MSKSIGFDIAFVDSSIYGKDDDLIFAKKIAEIENDTKLVIPFQFDDRLIKKIEPVFKTQNTGFANIYVDKDGIVRSFYPKLKDDNSFVSVLLGADMAGNGLTMIDYVGKAKTFPSIPFIDVYNSKLPAEFFKNKIVLIGATSPDLHDFFNTPFGIISGVEIQANILSTIYSGKFFSQVNFLILIFILIFSSILPHFIFKLRKILYSIFLSVIYLFVVNFASFVLFNFYILLPSLFISISFIISSILFVILRYSQESKEKKLIKNMFQYYLTPDVISELINDPSKLSLGGEKRDITIFFSDIRGFTTISESLSAEKLVTLLNKYLTSMTDVLMENRGVLDKYIGDAIMAFWGAPIVNPNRVIDACRSAVLMSKNLRELNLKLKEDNFPSISIGMGINDGEVIVGNMGSNTRFNYTIMGDEVNFASRLEGLNKNYGTECLISQSVFEKIKNLKEFKIRELDKVIVKGKSEPKVIYELILLEKENIDLILSNFKSAKDLYLGGHFNSAKNIFEKNFKDFGDMPSKTFFDRCVYLEQNRPLNWQGIFEFKDK